MSKKQIALLGSTGSIGTQTLDVIAAHSDVFSVTVLTAQNNADLLIEQAAQFRPQVVVIGNETLRPKVASALAPLGIEVYAGKEALASVAESDHVDIVLTALVGYSGLLPTMRAIKAGKDIALANKETLVVAGELIADLARENKVAILPVDSEHSAIFQCLVGEEQNPIEKIILTASGGPFRGKDRTFLANVTKAQALKHPNWTMGAKITIDSATLMNKGLEVIEAKWLFDLTPGQIDVVVHPQSIIHSMVQFEDGSIKAQMGLPDMRLPIQYALGYPHRLRADFPRFDFTQYPSLTFEKPDTGTFRNLSLAFEALTKGGNLPCVINAANEVAVAAFLNDEIGFLEISDVIEGCAMKVAFVKKPDYQDYVASDTEARRVAAELVHASV
ncbi:1-deoxy-D-xylulose-5-phosphate reductoisomerase [Persicitalea jodogahamensis]|uniref:1-deoxy-D-xylulose 5-phosphate reductoisomerase n=1 Tax=Persicitalea jodogahamensis TaxID=402147 RepID=A0A8J3D3R0_9BACT|nr:1-deoxy-D-xylulose-5-phosphate reductoisomerase [Persicitalea jodogahamensis]GHB69534.1 1-deoxy-D-xylulose 5-phosphate reductoisomerase [Persicitalea jodogahamensis]